MKHAYRFLVISLTSFPKLGNSFPPICQVLHVGSVPQATKKRLDLLPFRSLPMPKASTNQP